LTDLNAVQVAFGLVLVGALALGAGYLWDLAHAGTKGAEQAYLVLDSIQVFAATSVTATRRAFCE